MLPLALTLVGALTTENRHTATCRRGRALVYDRPVPSARPPKLPFKRLGEYEVLAPISEGGMATVWLGRPTEHAEHADRLVALKVIRPEHARNKEFIAMFRDEAAIASRLSHPNIVAIHGLGHDGRQHFLAMEVLRGRPLFELWDAAQARGTRLPREVVAWIGARVADALQHAHEMVDERGQPQNVVHRDVNPANIFITQGGVPKLIDFGLAKARDRLASTAIGVVKGKLAYLAPEQVLGHPADHRADVFALGVTLWELTLDRRLFRDDSDVETIRRVREAFVPDPLTLDADYPPALAAALVRALTRDPADRWQTAGELRDALDAFVREAGVAVDAQRVSTLVAGLSTTRGSAAWETLVDEAAVGPERIRVWDDERQKLTWMHASVEATEQSSGAAEDVAPAPEAGTAIEQLDRALASRLSDLDAGSDAVGVARAHLERALVDEVLGDGSAAAQHAEASLRAAPTAFAHEILRRLRHARGAAAAEEMLKHLDAELAECSSAQPRADLLAERARLLDAAGQKASLVREAWEQVLASSPLHAAALRGLEASLLAEQAHESLASHLHRMAEAYVADARLSAWLHVERARVLDRSLAQPDAAKAALARALELDPGIGPVRTACIGHAAAHGDPAWLVELLLQEAVLEGPGPRAAALEVDAACIARDRLGNADRAASLFQSASGRLASSASVRRHALEALVALHEAAGRPHEALRARRDRLADTREPRCRAHQLRAIATLEESLGNRDAAIVAVQDALTLSPTDATLAEELDRLLETASSTDRRIDLWTREAAAAGAPRERARLLVRAARLAESLGDAARAIEHLRAALVAHAADDEAVDLLLRLLAAPPTGAAIAEARARIAVHAHAAEHAEDPRRRIAHLEAIALLEEESIGDAPRAAATYETILRIEPHRRIAVLGLARTAARAGDGGKLARALLDEAEGTRDEATADSLRVRAAEALATIDAERALVLVHQVLKRDPSHAAARQVERRLHEAAGRWAQVDASVGAQIEHAADPRARLSLWLARAEVQRSRLGAVREALASLRAALALDPGHPAAREALEAQLAALGDPRAMRDGLVELATSETDAVERARVLARAAEIDEHVLADDDHAAELLGRALADAPGESWIEERRVRLQIRRARQGDASGLFPAMSDRPDGEASPSAVARLGALWAKAALVEWTLPESDATDLFERIVSHAPGDRAALDAIIRLALPKLRTGDGEARGRLETAVLTRLEQASSDTEKLCLHLVLALALDAGETRSDRDSRRALEHYRKALRVDDRSVVAAAGAARLGAALGDAEASVAAAIALAHLTSSARQRAVLLVQGASQSLSSQDARFGHRPARLARAAELLERALDADPEALPAVALLIAVRGEDGQRELLLAALRAAFERAQSRDAILILGAEIARVASLDPPDRVLAIDALRRVLATAPDHAPTLRGLIDQYVAQGAWGEAAEALETLAKQARDPQARLGALLELASLYGRTLKRPAEVERVLRAALDADPTSLHALRSLVHHLRETSPLAAEIVTLLARIADLETEPETKAAALSDLATLHLTTGDAAAAEAALVEAIAQAPSAARIGRLVAGGRTRARARATRRGVPRDARPARDRPRPVAGRGRAPAPRGGLRTGDARGPRGPRRGARAHARGHRRCGDDRVDDRPGRVAPALARGSGRGARDARSGPRRQRTHRGGDGRSRAAGGCRWTGRRGARRAARTARDRRSDGSGAHRPRCGDVARGRRPPARAAHALRDRGGPRRGRVEACTRGPRGAGRRSEGSAPARDGAPAAPAGAPPGDHARDRATRGRSERRAPPSEARCEGRALAGGARGAPRPARARAGGGPRGAARPRRPFGSVARGPSGCVRARDLVRCGPPGGPGLRVRDCAERAAGPDRGDVAARGQGHRAQAEEGARGAGAGSVADARPHPRRRRRLRADRRPDGAPGRVRSHRRPALDAGRGAREGRSPRGGDGQRGRGGTAGHARQPADR
jgi:serine/threonine protein kinase/tetratricopeptide (TPR) repeat protein